MYEEHGRPAWNYCDVPTLGRFSEKAAKIEVAGEKDCLYIHIWEKNPMMSFGATLRGEQAMFFYENIKSMYEQIRNIMENEKSEDES